MEGFAGFERDDTLLKVPLAFFSEVMPAVEHPGEFKVTLYMFWRVQNQEKRHYVWERELKSDPRLVDGLALHGAPLKVLDHSLELATARGTLLSVTVHEGSERFYMINGPNGRDTVARMEAGTWQPHDLPDDRLTLRSQRRTIYTIYEQNIGPLTPMVAEQLRDLEGEYAYEWIEDAIRIAVHINVRKLVYIIRVLERRAQEGKSAGTSDINQYLKDDNIEY
ncbi:MAG: DnaD domain-containing protein [Anaerolineae bacterium]